MLLLIDHYDSFVHNLARYFQRLGQTTVVVRSDEIDVTRVREFRPQAIVLSPGPCSPREAGTSLDLVRALANEVPMLGVCLGHQIIGAALGGAVIRAPQPMHGRTSRIHHHQCGLFADLPTPLTVCRYHSLVVAADSLPEEIEVTAQTDDAVVMALAHRTRPVFGVQFHPEAILTEEGFPLLANFLRLAGLSAPRPLPSIASERPLGITPPTAPLAASQPLTW